MFLHVFASWGKKAGWQPETWRLHLGEKTRLDVLACLVLRTLPVMDALTQVLQAFVLG